MKFLFLKILLAAVCVLSCLGACSQPQADYSGTVPIRMYRHSATDIITLNVPKGYLDHFVLAGPQVPGAREETAEILSTMYFAAEAGTLKPRSKENASSFVYPASLTDEMHFNLSTWYTKTSFEQKPIIQKLYVSAAQSAMFNCDWIREMEPSYGMERYVADLTNCPKRQQQSLKEVLFIDRDSNGDVKTQLVCASEEIPDRAEQVRSGKIADYNPMCQHEYFLPELNASVTMRYARFYIKDWKQTENRISQLLLSFLPFASKP